MSMKRANRGICFRPWHHVWQMLRSLRIEILWHLIRKIFQVVVRFPLEGGAEIDFFVFTLIPDKDDLEVRVEAMIGEERTLADALKGLVLRKEVVNSDTGIEELLELELTENGVYSFE